MAEVEIDTSRLRHASLDLSVEFDGKIELQ